METQDSGKDDKGKLQELSAFLGEDDPWDTSDIQDADSLDIESSLGQVCQPSQFMCRTCDFVVVINLTSIFCIKRSGHKNLAGEGALPPHLQARLNVIDKELEDFVL